MASPEFWLGVVDGSAEIVMTQLSKGDAATMVATPSDDGHLPLELAAFWGHLDIIKLLIAEGADVDGQSPRNGSTALHSATIQNHGPVAMYLLFTCDPKASMSIFDRNGRTAADFAGASEVMWGLFKAAGYGGPRKTPKELQNIGLPVEPPPEDGDCVLVLGERNVSGPRDDSECRRARSFGDVLGNTHEDEDE